ncbi:MAG TPA: hypothetical protein DD640_10420 [Clostridiales bacterium]|nr:hypothetical protein [Clostridiales bacterium]
MIKQSMSKQIFRLALAGLFLAASFLAFWLHRSQGVALAGFAALGVSQLQVKATLDFAALFILLLIIGIILSCAKQGIITAAILFMGRSVGESPDQTLATGSILIIVVFVLNRLAKFLTRKRSV